jgi:archaellum biogenesis ATPase FlaH
MRVFENSMHGGLGRGNLGVVASRPGVGKTALLVQIALDDLMRDRRVLHISHENAVDHVRAYYDEIFHDLASSMRLEAPEEVRLDIERNRQIYSHLGYAAAADARGDGWIKKIRETVAFALDVAHFSPDVVIVDGFDLAHATEDGVVALRNLAREREVELWLSVTTEQASKTSHDLAAPLDRFRGLFNVIVSLVHERSFTRLLLLKDHDNKELADFHLRLDPHSMRVLDDDVRPASDRPRNARKFRLHSGGARGAEAAFGECAERWGMNERNYSFEGHTMLARQRGVVTLSPGELRKGDFSLVYASRRLRRVLSDIPLVRSVLQTIWHQISAANQVFVVGEIQDDNTVRGGTGWGAELARIWKKPLFVFDQKRTGWFRWSGSAWEIANQPVIMSENFAGTGTQNLTDEGRHAIEELFFRSFGEPESAQG